MQRFGRGADKGKEKLSIIVAHAHNELLCCKPKVLKIAKHDQIQGIPHHIGWLLALNYDFYVKFKIKI